MRRRLLLIVLATTSLVVVAFAVPLAALVDSVTRDRAITAAERDVAALAPVLAVTTDRDAISAAIAGTRTGGDGRIAVWLPGQESIGDPTPADPNAVALARDRRLAFSETRGDDVELFTPVITGADGVSIVRARVPKELLERGVTTAWAALAGVALVLIAAAALVADRLGRSVTNDATELAGTAKALAGGDNAARARPGTTPELAEASRALNLLADRIDELLAGERERVADLSHRLRTPLTALRLSTEASGNRQLIDDVDRMEGAITELIRSARRPLHAGLASATCDVAAVLRERVSHWSALADDDNRTWTLDISPSVPLHVRLSADEAAAAVDAIVGNVFSHTPEGTPYEIRVDLEDGVVIVRISDAGPGIPDPDVALQRGVTQSGSSGLGLDIARSAAQSTGGTLEIAGSPLGGTSVILRLPLVTSA